MGHEGGEEGSHHTRRVNEGKRKQKQRKEGKKKRKRKINRIERDTIVIVHESVGEKGQKRKGGRGVREKEKQCGHAFS